MPASSLRCEVCSTPFYGRADASFCSTACRQKAYRQRIRSATPVITGSVTGQGPVPIGDTWMGGRFGGRFGNDYGTLAEINKHVLANVKTKAVRRKRLDAAEERAAQVIEEYVSAVAAIALTTDGDDFDYDTPLGGLLPATINPEHAGRLAADLNRVLPRVVELTSLLVRRSTEEGRSGVSTDEVCSVHDEENVKFTSAGEPYCMACDYMLFV